MATILLIIHIMIALALIGVVLLQRSEGGALGIGGGGGGGFMTGRGAANFLTRATGGLAAAFFATSLILTLIAQPTGRSILDTPTAPVGTQPSRAPAPSAPAPQLPSIDLNKANQGQQVPDTPAPAPEGPKVPQSK
jgi:preprotein translocase subunit SecG